MFRAVLKKSIATAAAVAAVAAVSAVSAPAATAASSCYPGSVTTKTVVSLTHQIGRFGWTNTVTVSVTTGSASVNGATVSITTPAGTKTVGVVDGKAKVSMPRNLAANHTYYVGATFKQQDCYAGSSGKNYYIVKKADSGVGDLRVHHVARPRVSGFVGANYGTPRGHVTVTLSRNGHVAQTKTVSLSGGDFSASFGKVRAGKWVATARYAGSTNYGSSKASTSFKVGR